MRVPEHAKAEAGPRGRGRRGRARGARRVAGGVRAAAEARAVALVCHRAAPRPRRPRRQRGGRGPIAARRRGG